MSNEERQPRTGPVLAIFAHPDDAEIAAGGLLAAWAAAGRAVHLLVLTNGDRGSSDPTASRTELAATRKVETESAADVLGLSSVRILSIHDGELENAAAVREAATRRVREVRAETVVSCDPTSVFFENRYYNHADHRTAGWVALDSVFPGSGNPHFFGEHLGEGLEIQEVHDVWLGWTNEPNQRRGRVGDVHHEGGRARAPREPAGRGDPLLRRVPPRGGGRGRRGRSGSRSRRSSASST